PPGPARGGQRRQHLPGERGHLGQQALLRRVEGEPWAGRPVHASTSNLPPPAGNGNAPPRPQPPGPRSTPAGERHHPPPPPRPWRPPTAGRARRPPDCHGRAACGSSGGSRVRIVSIGGGPAGLYAAILLKQADPARE